MTTFKIKSHLEINEKFQGVNITEFYYSNPYNLSNDEIINNFLHSDHIENDCVRDVVKNSSHKHEYLKGAFVLPEINVNDFKKCSKEEIMKFLSDILAEPDWREDIDDFKRIHDRFVRFLNDLNTNNYYSISKSWFDELNSIKLTPESWVYVYYFLILWIDNKIKILGFSEFDSD